MNRFSKITPSITEAFRKILGESHIFTDNADLLAYGHDETEDLNFPPELVLKPRTPEEISAILKICNQEKIPVTPRGAGTGLSGAALPIYGGVILSMERFNTILQIDERNLQATVEPGVINEVFRQAVESKGLFYPPDPASKGSCFLGGNIALSSGGPKAVKYGTTKEYVLNLEVVLPTGEIIWTGANVLKNSTGFNLTQLFVGSEGMLGVVTKIVFRLIPLPQKTVVMLVPFASAEKACESVPAVFKAGIVPSAMEFMERDAIDWALKYVSGLSMEIAPHVKAHLLIELDGNDLDVLMNDAEKISAIMQEFESEEILFADTEEQKQNLWRMRRCIGEAVKSHSVYKEEDTVVMRAELPRLLKGVKDIGKKYGFQSVCYGHAGDGNLHVNIIKGNMTEKAWNEQLPLGIREIFELCKKLGGTISGEHGIGLVQKDYMDIVFSDKLLTLQKEIRDVFDPNGIMNPGKMFN
ncbi:MAG TPA: FAD-linked oxidase C-terminal domain-containing protein [Bacteroidia bacterium]|jgi:glycolate oxidase|nr:FAD-linked oxidase C-terminal domain-containing protein [Bacteroidia bacterium]